MKRIASFEIDHTKLVKGLYISRKDTFNLACVTTFDVRMKTPYKDKPLKPATAHALEHCLATYLRNVKDDVIYVGVMGCMTGFYVVLYGSKGIVNLRKDLIDAFEWVTTIDKVPGASKVECGNYKFMNLEDAKREAELYIEVLRSMP